jgi:hypothetical protein
VWNSSTTDLYETIACEPLQNSSFPYMLSQNHLSPVCHRVAIYNLSMPLKLVFSQFDLPLILLIYSKCAKIRNSN